MWMTQHKTLKHTWAVVVWDGCNYRKLHQKSWQNAALRISSWEEARKFALQGKITWEKMPKCGMGIGLLTVIKWNVLHLVKKKM